MRNTKRTTISFLKNLIEQIKNNEISVEGISKTDHTDLISVSDYHKATPYKTGRFSLKIDLYDPELNNYKETMRVLLDKEE